MTKTKKIKYILLGAIIAIFFSQIIAIGTANSCGIFHSMYVKHIHNISNYPEEMPTTVTWTTLTTDMLNVEWKWNGSLTDTGTWYVETDTRLISAVGYFGPKAGCCTPFWIFTDVSLDDQVMIYNVFYDDDTIFNVTGETIHGSMQVWILEDDFGSEVWYEKTKGFLVNGTFYYLTDYEIFKFVETNAFQQAGEPGVPGYKLLFLIGVSSIAVIILITVIKRKLKDK